LEHHPKACSHGTEKLVDRADVGFGENNKHEQPDKGEKENHHHPGEDAGFISPFPHIMHTQAKIQATTLSALLNGPRRTTMVLPSPERPASPAIVASRVGAVVGIEPL
jgi:hypothetical protein